MANFRNPNRVLKEISCLYLIVCTPGKWLLFWLLLFPEEPWRVLELGGVNTTLSFKQQKRKRCLFCFLKTCGRKEKLLGLSLFCALAESMARRR